MLSILCQYVPSKRNFGTGVSGKGRKSIGAYSPKEIIRYTIAMESGTNGN